MAGALKKGLIFLLLLIFTAAAFFYFRGSSIITSAVETYGPEYAGAPVSLGDVGFSPFSGSAELSDFVVGNPEGYESEYAFKFDSFSVSLEPLSLFSDELHINEIRIEGPNIIFEPGKGGSNLQQLQKNLEAAAAESATKEEDAADTYVIIDHFYMTGATATLAANNLGLGERSVTLPDIHFKDIGSDGERITMVEATQQIMAAIMPHIMNAAKGELLSGAKDAAMEKAGEKGKELLEKAKDKVGDKFGEGAEEKIRKGIGGLLGKKKKGKENNQ